MLNIATVIVLPYARIFYMKFSQSQVNQLADLIKIELTETESTQIAKQLATVVESVAILSELDTKDVNPRAQSHGLKNVLREDEPTPGLDLSKTKLGENLVSGYFAVQRVNV